MTITRLHQQHQDQPLSDIVARWQHDLAQGDYAAGTITKYGQSIRGFLHWYAQQEQTELTLDCLTPIVLVSYRRHLQHEAHLAASTINLRVNALRAWCLWLVDQGYLSNNPAARFRLVEHQPLSKREGLTAPQVNALLRAAERSRHRIRNYAIVQLLVQTGVRIDECTALTCEDITFGERSGMLRVRAGKGNKVREVPLNASARTALAAYIAPRLQVKPDLKAVASEWTTLHGPLWRSQKGKELSTGALGHMIGGLVRQAGARVPQTTSAHTLRHTFARNYLSQYPGDIVGLAALLGHSSLDTTRLYGEPTVSQLAQRVEQLDSNAYH